MNRKVQALTFLAAASIALSLPAPRAAQAERKNPLADAPAVRHRLLLVKSRFELTPAFESTINADYMHTVGGGLKLEYHFTDMWSVGVVGFYGKSLSLQLVRSGRTMTNAKFMV